MNYSKDHRPGGNSGKRYARRGFGGGGSFGGRDNAKPTLYPAICSECDKECEVPFKPSGDKPVFCRDCFKNQGDSKPRESGKRDFGGGRFGGRDSRPAARKSTFDKPAAGNAMTSEQFKILNSKLDRILTALES